MRYTVVWLPQAQLFLANFWNNAPDKQEVTNACNRCDLALRDDPEPKEDHSAGFGFEKIRRWHYSMKSFQTIILYGC